MKAFAALLPICFALASGCSSKYSPPIGDGDDGDDDGIVPPDAGPVLPPDAPPLPAPYPSGPYGTGNGDTIENLAWQGYADTDADPDSDPFNEPPHTVTLEDFFVERDAGSRILVIINSAGWCGACQEEAAEMPEFTAAWTPKGVRFLTAMLETGSGDPAPVSYAKTWGESFDLTTPVVADPDAALDPYYTSNGITYNLYIDTTTMTIVGKMSGYDRYEAEAIFDAHVD